jgi:hypothetical protein
MLDWDLMKKTKITLKSKYGMIWSKHEQNRIVGVRCFDALHMFATNTYGKDYH